jgi:beta-glucosidase
VRAVGQVPLFFGQRPTGRPADPKDPFTSKYLDVSPEPLFSFGHGLTYGRFQYFNLRAAARTVTERDTVDVLVDVTNEGRRAARETVFLFTHDKVASVTRPLLELRAFGKIDLQPGETGTVTLRLAGRDLRFLGAGLQPVFEPGEVEVLVGPCADRSRLLVTSIRRVAGKETSRA